MHAFVLPSSPPQSQHTSTHIGVMDFFQISKVPGTPRPVAPAASRQFLRPACERRRWMQIC